MASLEKCIERTVLDFLKQVRGQFKEDLIEARIHINHDKVGASLFDFRVGETYVGLRVHPDTQEKLPSLEYSGYDAQPKLKKILLQLKLESLTEARIRLCRIKNNKETSEFAEYRVHPADLTSRYVSRLLLTALHFPAKTEE